MAVTRDDVSRLADTYRATLAEGDRQLADEPVERALLHAAVAESAAETDDWLRTRVDDGRKVAEPLSSLVEDLLPDDRIGQGLDLAKEKLWKAASSTVSSIVTTGTAPAWLTGVVGTVAGFVVAIAGAGEATGAAIAAALIGGVSYIGAAVRFLGTAGPQAASSLASATTSLYQSADQLGRKAESVFDAVAKPAVASLSDGYVRSLGPSQRIRQVRGSAKSTVAVALVAAFAGLAIFVGGVVVGFVKATENPSCDQVFTSDCLPQNDPLGSG